MASFSNLARILVLAVLMMTIASVRMAEAGSPQPLYNWTGLYVGGTLGANFNSWRFIDEIGAIAPGGGTSGNGSALNGGGTLGYNWQINSVVLGVEADGSFTNFKQKHGPFPTYNVSYAQSQWDWFATLRARLGWSFDDVLIYATGGAAWARYDNKAEYTYTSAPQFRCGDPSGYWSCISGTSTGFVVGAGVEKAFAPNWSGKVEYLYIGMPTFHTTDVAISAPYGWKNNAQILRAGVNYRF